MPSEWFYKNKESAFIKLLVLALAATLAGGVYLAYGLAKKDKGKDVGFDEFGYNRTARLFNGTGLSWCMGKLGWTEEQCRSHPAYGPYSDDKLVMKWNAEWDRGNAESWGSPPYDAWCDNQWNGMAPGGSGETWHYKTVWYGPCGPYGTPLPEGGYCIWGQFQVVMSHGTFENAHFWDAHAIPSGHGVYP